MKLLVLFSTVLLLFTCTTQADDDWWYQFGDSVMKVSLSPQNEVTISYAEPGPMAQALGIAPNTLFFKGVKDANSWLSGVAYGFKAGCPPATYAFDLKGLAGQTIMLYGAPPVFAKDSCKVDHYSATVGTVIEMAVTNGTVQMQVMSN